MRRAVIAMAGSILIAAPAQAAENAPVDVIGDLISQAVKAVETVATDLKVKATLYHAGAYGVGARDSLGCRVVPMRTLAVDPTYIPRRTIVFIQETVGLAMPDGSRHDGMWYASDVGGAIKGPKIDLYTGEGRGSMAQFFEKKLNVAVLNAAKVGAFKGCPPG